MSRRMIMLPAIAGMVLGLAQTAQADTYHQLKACLRNCINTTEAGSWARLVCVLDCYAAWADQKISINVDISPGSTGYGDLEGHRYLLIDEGNLATVVFDVLSGDPLERIDLILVSDEHNPGDPGFGILVGSDNDGGDGWSVTFDPATMGASPWSGVLVGEAHFTGHDLEIDGDVAVITARSRFGGAAARMLTNGVAGDGELEVRPDGYGAATVWGWATNYDWYDPAGDDARANCSFAASTFVYNPATQDRLALGEPGHDLDTTYNNHAEGGATLSYAMLWPLAQFDSDGNGYNDAGISTFHVFGGTANCNLVFDLVQTVSQPVEGSIATWDARYTITNIGAEPASFLIERHDDLDLWFDASAEDCAGTASVGGIRNVYMREADSIPNHENLVVALSSPTPGYVYCAARSGFDPDGEGPDPNMVYGTDFQIWDNYGLPASWQNYTAGIGYNVDGILPEQEPAGGAAPYDGFMVLQWEVTLAAGEATEIDVVTTYGSETPITECPGDLDGDGDVDLSDLAQLLGNYGMTEGATYEDGDLDGDGDVDLADLAALLGVYGTTC
jgi:hypothetical protein